MNKEKPSIHTVQGLGPNTYRIEEAGIGNAYLLLGKTKGLLIDSGIGLGSIAETVSGVTELPVEVALTAFLPHHSGGRFAFPAFFVHAKSNTPKYIRENKRPACLSSAWFVFRAKGDFGKIAYRNPQLLLIDDNTVFDLGDRLIRVMMMPGRTKSSVIYVDEANRLAFVGEALGKEIHLDDWDSVSVEEWLSTAGTLLPLTEKTDLFSFDGERFQKEKVEELIETAKRIVDGAPYVKLAFGKGAYPCLPDEAPYRIVFNRKKIKTPPYWRVFLF